MFFDGFRNRVTLTLWQTDRQTDVNEGPTHAGGYAGMGNQNKAVSICQIQTGQLNYIPRLNNK